MTLSLYLIICLFRFSKIFQAHSWSSWDGDVRQEQPECPQEGTPPQEDNHPHHALMDERAYSQTNDHDQRQTSKLFYSAFIFLFEHKVFLAFLLQCVLDSVYNTFRRKSAFHNLVIFLTTSCFILLFCVLWKWLILSLSTILTSHVYLDIWS